MTFCSETAIKILDIPTINWLIYKAHIAEKKYGKNMPIANPIIPKITGYRSPYLSAILPACKASRSGKKANAAVNMPISRVFDPKLEAYNVIIGRVILIIN